MDNERLKHSHLKIFYLFLLFFAFLPHHAQSQETKPSESEKSYGPILEISFQGLHAIDPNVVADVAELRVAETFSKERLENSIDTLRKWGIFSKIEVVVQYENEGVRLTYELAEGFIIKDIKINGNFPLLDSQVRRTLFLNPGEIYDSSRLTDQIDRLDRLYEQEGYSGSTVIAIEDYNEADHEVTLQFKIKKGITYRLRNAEVEGNTALKPKKIRHIIYTFCHYKPKKIKKNLAKIHRLYVKKGYVRARVRLDKESYDYDARKVDINVAIRQGKRVFVGFEGNDHFWNRTLRKKLTIYEGEDFDDYELDASKTQLINFYKEHGYTDVQVEWSKTKLEDENFLITFKITEGPQRRIKKIEFEGTTGIKEKKLRDVIVSKKRSLTDPGYFIQPLFEEDLDLVEEHYKKQGFLEAKIESWDKTYNKQGTKVILTVNIQEKQRATVNNLEIVGLSEEQKEDFSTGLLCRPGQAYSPTLLLQDIQGILVNLSNSGFPYAQIQHQETNIRDNLWDLRLEIKPGPQVKIGRLLIVGNSLTREKVIRKNLRIKEGSLFSAKNLLQSEINLRRLGIFDSVRVETLGLSNRQEVVQALISVQEKKSKIIDLEASFNTDEGFSGKLVFNKLNMWGTGKNGNIKVQAGQEVTGLEINYVDPRLMGRNLQFLIGVFTGLENRPFFESFKSGILSSLFRDFGPYLNAYGNLQFDYVNFDESKTVVSQLQPGESAEDHTRLTTTLGVTYDRRDNFGDPRSGYYMNSTLAFTNQFVQSAGNYFTGHATFGDWYSPTRYLTIANNLRIAKIFPVPEGTDIPVDARLYVGGDDTVRGFSQDSLLPTGGNFALIHNLEFQFHPFGNFQVVGFLDSGIDIESMDQFNLYNLRHSAGPGVRYLTPVGPLRLEYGFKLDPHPGESTGRLHFSFGYFF